MDSNDKDMNLFQKKETKLNSEQISDFKIECDALTDEDIECIAYLISQRIKFKKVIGIPTGGIRLQKALEKYCENSPANPILICDDVYTTGGSMTRMFAEVIKHPDTDTIHIRGYVIFSRGECPPWITPLFQLKSIN